MALLRVAADEGPRREEPVGDRADGKRSAAFLFVVLDEVAVIELLVVLGAAPGDLPAENAGGEGEKVEAAR